MTWISVDEELPPCDGTYEIAVKYASQFWIEDGQWICLAYYDGFGFIADGVYRTPLKWRMPILMNRKYGKVQDATKKG